jgi:hypothetical protein
VEKKCGIRPDWSGNVLAASGYVPKRTETELSEEKYFFWRLAAAVGRLCTSTWKVLSWSTATAHLRLPPYTVGSAAGAADVDGGDVGWMAARKVSAGIICPSMSVSVMFPLL